MTDIQLSPDQSLALNKIHSFMDSDTLELSLGGYAGTGKTTLIRELLREKDGGSPFDYLHSHVMSLTGKAVSVLCKKGVQAQTIHSTIYYCKIINHKPIFFLRDDVDCDMFIVDEASMVSDELYQNIMSFDLPVLWVGDHGQLEPIGKNPGLMLNPDIRLEEIHRQAMENPIIGFANDIRKGKSPRLWLDNINGLVREKRTVSVEELLSANQIICAMNHTRVKLNKYIRKLKDLPADEPVVGDKVICLKNKRQAGIYNGLQGVIIDIEPDGKLTYYAKINLDDDCTHEGPIYKEQFHREKGLAEPAKKVPGATFWDYSYAITCHKAQGSEWPFVVVFEEKCPLWAASRWGYTAATRAEEKLVYGV